jgi:hypothetical protein
VKEIVMATLRIPSSSLGFAVALAFTLAAGVVVCPSRAVQATGTSGFSLTVLVDGVPRPEYGARGTVYVEALRGKDYALQLSNPLPTRVAVALSVDGLNTIDAQHTSARDARKWVLGPYETITISGWQVDQAAARKFVFTGERQSYGAKLGQTENLGVIEAVFFAEKQRVWEKPRPMAKESRRDGQLGPVQGGVLGASPGRDEPAMEVPRSAAAAGSGAKAAPAPALSDEYAATGMGNRTRHEVVQVALDLQPDPVTTARVRYEFRTALLKLGVLPAWDGRSPIERREGASGFERFCPEPGR